MRRLLAILGGIALAGCAQQEEEAQPQRISEPARERAGPAPAPQPAPEPSRERTASRYAALKGVWAAEEACGDRDREWRFEDRVFRAGDMNCDILFLEDARESVRLVGECLVEGFSDGAEDSFLLAPKAGGRLAVTDETIGVTSPDLIRCGSAT